MPELPDISAYIGALEPRIIGQPLERVRLASVFLLRTADPPLASVEGLVVPIMGGFEDKTKALVVSDKAPRLLVRGYALMGAVIIGN